jgi:hypothetical protein
MIPSVSSGSMGAHTVEILIGWRNTNTTLHQPHWATKIPDCIILAHTDTTLHHPRLYLAPVIQSGRWMKIRPSGTSPFKTIERRHIYSPSVFRCDIRSTTLSECVFRFYVYGGIFGNPSGLFSARGTACFCFWGFLFFVLLFECKQWGPHPPNEHSSPWGAEDFFCQGF